MHQGISSFAAFILIVLDTDDLTFSCLHSIGGEPVPPDIEEWCYSKLGKGKCVFIDNWGQAGIYYVIELS